MFEYGFTDLEIWQTKKRSNYTKVQDFVEVIFKRRTKLKLVGEFSDVCSLMVLKCLYLDRIGEPNISWRTVNKFARSVTKWKGVFEKRFSSVYSYIHHTRDYPPTLSWGNTVRGFFHDLKFVSDLADSKSISGVNLRYPWESNICYC